MYSFLVRLRKEEYGENVKFRYQLMRLKDNNWAQENERLIEKLKIYEEKKMI